MFSTPKGKGGCCDVHSVTVLLTVCEIWLPEECLLKQFSHFLFTNSYAQNRLLLIWMRSV